MSRAETRGFLYGRQDGMCPLCEYSLGKNWLHSKDVDIDHVIPRGRPHYGPDTIDNIALVHRPCNQIKGSECEGCQNCVDALEKECE